MKAPTPTDAREHLATSYALDRLWSETMGLPDGDSKEGPLRLVAQLLEREGVPYALIDGVAVQLHTAEPRSTLDSDLAVPTYADIPRQALLAAGVVDLADGVRLRVASVADLIVLTLAAAAEPARRPSKREHDLADVLALLEEHPELASAEMVERVKDVRRRLMA